MVHERKGEEGLNTICKIMEDEMEKEIE